MKERVRNLEADLDRALREKTDSGCEVRRLTGVNEGLEKELKELRVQQMATKGDT
jgi:hypothetical protein